jgi:hypothetical protein
MNEPLSKDGRMALITDVTGAPLDACEAEELELLADLLADPAMWDEPRPELEHLVVGAVAAADASVTPLPSRPVEHRRRRRGLFSVAGIAAAAAIVVAAVGVVDSAPGNDMTATLAGTRLAPSAHASATFKRTNSGFRITLEAAHLPHLDGHHFYEAWLKNGDGDAVPVGTFSSSDGHVTLWSGVSPTGSRLAVTVEPNDNDQSSSGRVILAGPVQTH